MNGIVLGVDFCQEKNKWERLYLRVVELKVTLYFDLWWAVYQYCKFSRCAPFTVQNVSRPSECTQRGRADLLNFIVCVKYPKKNAGVTFLPVKLITECVLLRC